MFLLFPRYVHMCMSTILWQRSESGGALYVSAFRRRPPVNPEDPTPQVPVATGDDGCVDDAGIQPC